MLFGSTGFLFFCCSTSSDHWEMLLHWSSSTLWRHRPTFRRRVGWLLECWRLLPALLTGSAPQGVSKEIARNMSSINVKNCLQLFSLACWPWAASSVVAEDPPLTIPPLTLQLIWNEISSSNSGNLLCRCFLCSLENLRLKGWRGTPAAAHCISGPFRLCSQLVQIWLADDSSLKVPF